MISEKDKGFDLIANDSNEARRSNATLNELYDQKFPIIRPDHRPKVKGGASDLAIIDSASRKKVACV